MRMDCASSGVVSGASRNTAALHYFAISISIVSSHFPGWGGSKACFRDAKGVRLALRRRGWAAVRGPRIVTICNVACSFLLPLALEPPLLSYFQDPFPVIKLCNRVLRNRRNPVPFGQQHPGRSRPHSAGNCPRRSSI